MDSLPACSDGAVTDSFTVNIAVLHTQDPQLLDPKRAELIAGLKSVPQVSCRVYRGFSTDITAQLYFAHYSEPGHQRLLDTHCEPDGPYYVLFSAVVKQIKLSKSRGLLLPAQIVEARAVTFVKQWVRVCGFPGWDYLIGEPERDWALEYLHQRLAGDEGNGALKRIEDLCLPGVGDDKVKCLIEHLKMYHKKAPVDLHEIRELLLSSDGLIARLVKLRHERR